MTKELDFNLRDVSSGAMKLIMLSVIADNVEFHTNVLETAKNKVIAEIERRTNSKFNQLELEAIEDTKNYINDCVDLIKLSDNGNFDLVLEKVICESEGEF